MNVAVECVAVWTLLLPRVYPYNGGPVQLRATKPDDQVSRVSTAYNARRNIVRVNARARSRGARHVYGQGRQHKMGAIFIL